MNPYERQIVGMLTESGRRIAMCRDYRSRNLARVIASGETGTILRRQHGELRENHRVLVRWDCDGAESWHDYGDLEEEQ